MAQRRVTEVSEAAPNVYHMSLICGHMIAHEAEEEWSKMDRYLGTYVECKACDVVSEERRLNALPTRRSRHSQY